MKKMVFVFFLVLLILTVSFQSNVEAEKLNKDEQKEVTLPNEELTQLLKAFALIQKKESPYEWTKEIPYKDVKPDLVPPGALIISRFDDERLYFGPTFLPYAVPEDNKPTFIPTDPVFHIYKWLKKSK